MNRSLQRYLDAASGLTTLTAAKAEQVVKGLVRSGEAAGDQASDLVKDLVDRQQRNRDAVVSLVKSEAIRAVRAMGLATSGELEALHAEVAELKRLVARLDRLTPPAAAPAGAAAKKATAKKATAKKATAKRATAKKATAKKATAKKATAKKATAKKATAAKRTTASGSGS